MSVYMLAVLELSLHLLAGDTMFMPGFDLTTVLELKVRLAP